jgi:hypothetical protein
MYGYYEAPDYRIDVPANRKVSGVVHRKLYNGGTVCRDAWKHEPRSTYRDEEVTCRVCLKYTPR